VPSFEEFAMVFLDEFFYSTVLSSFESIREFLSWFRGEPPLRFATSLGDVNMRWFVVLVAEEVEAKAILQKRFGSHRFSKIPFQLGHFFRNASMIPFAATGIRVPGPYTSKHPACLRKS